MRRLRSPPIRSEKNWIDVKRSQNSEQEVVMTNLMQINCGDTEIWIEAEGEIIPKKKARRVSVSESMKKTMLSYEEISNTINAYCTSLVGTFKGFQAEYAPDRIKAEFGLKLSGEGNVYVVKSAAEGSLKITAEWELKHG
jgi:hypothetical protein